MAALLNGEVAAPTADEGQPDEHVGGPMPEQMVALACMCSSPIHVDARKRTRAERPMISDESDVRLVQRQRGSGPHPPKPPPPPPPPPAPPTPPPPPPVQGANHPFLRMGHDLCELLSGVHAGSQKVGTLREGCNGPPRAPALPIHKGALGRAGYGRHWRRSVSLAPWG